MKDLFQLELRKFKLCFLECILNLMFRKTHHDLGEGLFYQSGFAKLSLTVVCIVMRLSLAFKNQISFSNCCHPELGEGLFNEIIFVLSSRLPQIQPDIRSRCHEA
jgi:hypothetical protein